PMEPKRFDISADIAAINAMKRSIPALNEEGPQSLLTTPDDPVVALARQTNDGEEWAFTLVNTDDTTAQEIDVDDLLAAAGGHALMLEEMTPGAEERGLGLHLLLEPLAVRVVRGRRPAPVRVP